MLRPLSSKEKKFLRKQLKDQFGFSEKINYSFFITSHKKIFIFNRDIEIDLSKIRVNNLGMYFASLNPELRLTIEGAQIIGPESDNKILEVNEVQLKDWMQGKDISTKEEFEGFVLVRYKKDFYGTGKYKEGKILNYIPRERRLKN